MNTLFAPSVEEVAWARRVLDAAAVARGTAIAVDGKRVDQPVLLRATPVLRQAAA